MSTDDMPLASRITAVEATLSELKKQFSSGGTSETFYYKRYEHLVAREHVLKQDLDSFLRARNAPAVADTLAIAVSQPSEEEMSSAIAVTTEMAQNENGESWAIAWLEAVGDALHTHRGKLIDIAVTGSIAVARALL